MRRVGEALAFRFSTMANDRLPTSLPHRSLPREPQPSEPDSRPHLPYESERAEIEAAALLTMRAAEFPADYVDRVHHQAARFALRTAAPGDIRAAIALLEEQTNVQALAPVDSRNRGVGAAKKVVRKAVFFAVHHLTEQMRALGWAATSVGTAAAERIEQLEARVHELEVRLEREELDERHGGSTGS
jgi:hypothetical protein